MLTFIKRVAISTFEQRKKLDVFLRNWLLQISLLKTMSAPFVLPHSQIHVDIFPSGFAYWFSAHTSIPLPKLACSHSSPTSNKFPVVTFTFHAPQGNDLDLARLFSAAYDDATSMLSSLRWRTTPSTRMTTHRQATAGFSALVCDFCEECGRDAPRQSHATAQASMHSYRLHVQAVHNPHAPRYTACRRS